MACHQPTMRRLIFALLSCAVFVAFMQPAIADDQETANEEKAKEAFQNGSELFEAENFSAAAIQFRIAYRLKPTWKLLYNIGQCETGAKRYGLALEAFEQYLVEAGDDITISRRDEVRSETARLREMVGSLKILGPSGTEVFVDGVKRGNLPLSGHVPVTAAMEHTVSGVLNGKKMNVVSAKVLTSQVFEVVLSPTETPATADDSNSADVAVTPAVTEEGPGASPKSSSEAEMPPLPQDAEPQKDKTGKPADNSTTVTTPRVIPFRTLGIVSLATGGAALAASIVTGSLALKKDGELSDQCLEGFDNFECVVPNSTSNQDTKSQRDMLGQLTTGLWIGGGVLAATGVVLLIVSKKKSESATTAIQIQPILNQQTAAGVFTWSF